MAGNKKKEIQKKTAHLDRISEAKAKRGAEPLLVRAVPTKEEKPTFLIVCEGKNTEPSYFKQFRLSSAIFKTIGKGYNTIALVNHASQLNQKEKYEQVWCVFDKDSNTPANFNTAITTAENQGFHVAYSNQAFEYWLILHFEDHQGGAMPRTDYNDKINHYISPLGATYEGEGDKFISECFFDLLSGVDSFTGRKRIELAISRAKRNYGQFSHHSPAEEESSTTVFRLVEEILKYV